MELEDGKEKDKAASGPNKLNLYLDLRTSVQYVGLLPRKSDRIDGGEKEAQRQIERDETIIMMVSPLLDLTHEPTEEGHWGRFMLRKGRRRRRFIHPSTHINIDHHRRKVSLHHIYCANGIDPPMETSFRMSDKGKKGRRSSGCARESIHCVRLVWILETPVN